MDLITYETVRQVHRAEKEEPLQTLPTNFYQAVRNWLISKDGKRDSSSLLEVENAKRLAVARASPTVALAATGTDG